MPIPLETLAHRWAAAKDEVAQQRAASLQGALLRAARRGMPS